MKKVRIGYICRDALFPAWCIIVVEREGRFFGWYPSGDEVLLRDVHSLDDLKKRDTFFLAPPDWECELGDVVLGLSPDQFFLGSVMSTISDAWEYVNEQARLGKVWDSETLRVLSQMIEIP